MIRGRCPICSTGFEIASLDDLPSFPFCTERCRLIDLGRWVDAKYVIPAKAGSEPEEDDSDHPSDQSEEQED